MSCRIRCERRDQRRRSDADPHHQGDRRLVILRRAAGEDTGAAPRRASRTCRRRRCRRPRSNRPPVRPRRSACRRRPSRATASSPQGLVDERHAARSSGCRCARARGREQPRAGRFEETAAPTTLIGDGEGVVLRAGNARRRLLTSVDLDAVVERHVQWTIVADVTPGSASARLSSVVDELRDRARRVCCSPGSIDTITRPVGAEPERESAGAAAGCARRARRPTSTTSDKRPGR